MTETNPNDERASGDQTNRLRPQVRAVDHCRECGKRLGAGYLCDDCDEVTFVNE